MADRLTDQPRQLALGLQLEVEASFDNYWVAADNSLPVAAIKEFVQGTGDWFIYLWGIGTAGVSHLLKAACAEVMEQQYSASYIPLDRWAYEEPEAVLQGMEMRQLVVLDHMQAVVGIECWEEALFYFFNRHQANGGRLLVGANHPPQQLGVQLADYRSRLSWGTVYQLHGLDDNDKREALRLHAERRGLELSDDVVQFILTRGSRDWSALCQALDHLDRASLAAKRRITIPLVKKTMGW